MNQQSIKKTKKTHTVFLIMSCTINFGTHGWQPTSTRSLCYWPVDASAKRFQNPRVAIQKNNYGEVYVIHKFNTRKAIIRKRWQTQRHSQNLAAAMEKALQAPANPPVQNTTASNPPITHVQFCFLVYWTLHNFLNASVNFKHQSVL